MITASTINDITVNRFDYAVFTVTGSENTQINDGCSMAVTATPT